MAGSRLFFRWRNDPDITREHPGDLFEYLEPRRVDAVVVGEKYPHARKAMASGAFGGKASGATIGAFAALVGEAKRRMRCRFLTRAS
jgi:hypothetical protein